MQGRALSGLSNSFVEERSIRDPLNEEADIRAEMGRLKEQNEVTSDDPTNRAIYQWSETSRTKEGLPTSSS